MAVSWENAFFVAALTGQGVVHIGQGDDLRADGDVIALEAVRVAPAIPALMVPAGDVVGGLQQGLILKVFQPSQHVGTLHTVGLDDLELLFGQPTGLVEDVFVNGNLPISCRAEASGMLSCSSAEIL